MTFYLIPVEREIYDRLPAKLKKEWGGLVSEEKGDAWETDEQLRARLDIVRKQLSPKDAVALGKMIHKTKKVGIEGISEKDFPRDALMQILFLLGAIGITDIIYVILRKAESVNDLEVAAFLSSFRHKLLLANAIPLRS